MKRICLFFPSTRQQATHTHTSNPMQTRNVVIIEQANVLGENEEIMQPHDRLTKVQRKQKKTGLAYLALMLLGTGWLFGYLVRCSLRDWLVHGVAISSSSNPLYKTNPNTQCMVYFS